MTRKASYFFESRRKLYMSDINPKNDVSKNRREWAVIIQSYVKLLSNISIALILISISTCGIQSTLTQLKIKSDSMAIYERIVTESDNYNKLDLLNYLQSLDPNNTAISIHKARVEERIKFVESQITDKDNLIAETNGKIKKYESQIDNLGNLNKTQRDAIDILSKETQRLKSEKEELQNSLWKNQIEEKKEIINILNKTQFVLDSFPITNIADSNLISITMIEIKHLVSKLQSEVQSDFSKNVPTTLK